MCFFLGRFPLQTKDPQQRRKNVPHSTKHLATKKPLRLPFAGLEDAVLPPKRKQYAKERQDLSSIDFIGLKRTDDRA